MSYVEGMLPLNEPQCPSAWAQSKGKSQTLSSGSVVRQTANLLRPDALDAHRTSKREAAPSARVSFPAA